MVTLVGPRNGEPGSPELRIDDAGPDIPAVARREVLDLDVEPGTFGRPNTVGLFVAALIVAAQGGSLELRDRDRGGAEGARVNGLRVAVIWPS